MECVSITNFVVLINGSPSSSLSASRGLHQGCPLYPFLFLLMVEGLSLIIHREKKLGRIRGINLSSTFSITYILFVDNVVLFSFRSYAQWKKFRLIVDLFMAATGMAISSDKLAFLFNNLSSSILEQVMAIFPYRMDPIQCGFKYLGYWLKPFD